MNILYLGLFRFPEGDAAASRILNNARLFRDLGHTVKILSFGGEYRVQDASPGGYIYDGLQYEITHRYTFIERKSSQVHLSKPKRPKLPQ